MTVRADITDSVLDWIVSKVCLESLPETVWKNLMQWKRKEKIPTFNQVEATSAATGIPLGYFSCKRRPRRICFWEHWKVQAASCWILYMIWSLFKIGRAANLSPMIFLN